MTKFHSRETEEYYYKTLRKYGIMHISWQENVIVTKEMVDELIRRITGEESYMDHKLRSEPFVKSP